MIKTITLNSPIECLEKLSQENQEKYNALKERYLTLAEKTERTDADRLEMESLISKVKLLTSGSDE